MCGHLIEPGHSFIPTSFIHIAQPKCLRLLGYPALKWILERTMAIDWASPRGEPDTQSPPMRNVQRRASAEAARVFQGPGHSIRPTWKSHVGKEGVGKRWGPTWVVHRRTEVGSEGLRLRPCHHATWVVPVRVSAPGGAETAWKVPWGHTV